MEKVVCPKCGSFEIADAVTTGYANVIPKGKFFKSYPLLMDVCTDCGAIFNHRVKEYKKFRVSLKKNRNC